MNDVHHIITKRNEIGPFSTPPGSGSGVFGLELAGGKHKDLRSRCPVKNACEVMMVLRPRVKV